MCRTSTSAFGTSRYEDHHMPAPWCSTSGLRGFALASWPSHNSTCVLLLLVLLPTAPEPISPTFITKNMRVYACWAQSAWLVSIAFLSCHTWCSTSAPHLAWQNCCWAGLSQRTPKQRICVLKSTLRKWFCEFWNMLVDLNICLQWAFKRRDGRGRHWLTPTNPLTPKVPFHIHRYIHYLAISEFRATVLWTPSKVQS